MKILQSYYTSCKKGQLGGAGFQFYSYSDGLTPDELKEISMIGNYIPPLDLPTQPTAEERAALFPVAFSYFQLKSGRVGVCQSKYIGQDYSSRYGNFFSHCLVWEADALPYHPILLLGHPIFKDALNEQQAQEEEKPPLLPSLSLADLEPIPSFDLEDLGDDLSLEREQLLKQMMDALVAYQETNRRVIFAEKPEQSAWWIRALTLALPLSMAREITFTTYAFDPANAGFLLNHSPVKGTRFNYSNQMARDFQYFVFDMLNEQYSEVPASTQFSDLLPLAFTISAKNLLLFHRFLQQFNYRKLGPGIDNALGLFNLVQGGTSLQQLSYEEINRYFTFAVDYDKGEYIHQLVDFIRAQDNNYHLIEKLTSFEHSAFIVKILFAAAAKTSEEDRQSYSCEFYADSVLEFIDNKGQGLKREDHTGFVAYHQELLRTPFAQGDYCRQYLLSQKRVATIRQFLDPADGAAVHELKQLGAALYYAQLNAAYAGKADQLQAASDFLVDLVVQLEGEAKNLKVVFEQLSSAPGLFLDVLAATRERLATKNKSPEELYWVFLDIYERQDANWQRFIEEELDRREEVELLLRMARIKIDSAEDKAAAFDQYMEKNKAFFMSNADRFTEFLLQYARSIPLKSPGSHLDRLLTYATYVTQASFNNKLLQILEAEIDLRKPKKLDRKLLDNIHRLRENTSPTPAVNGLEYAYYVWQLEEGEVSLIEFLKAITPTGVLQTSAHEEMRRWALRALFEEMDEPKQFVYLMRFLRYHLASNELEEALEELCSYSHHYDPELLAWLVAYLAVEFQKAKEGGQVEYHELHKRIRMTLPSILMGHKLSFIERVGRKVPDDGLSPKLWNALVKKSKQLKEDNADKGVKGALKSFWGRK